MNPEILEIIESRAKLLKERKQFPEYVDPSAIVKCRAACETYFPAALSGITEGYCLDCFGEFVFKDISILPHVAEGRAILRRLRDGSYSADNNPSWHNGIRNLENR